MQAFLILFPHSVQDMLREPKKFSVSSVSPWCKTISNSRH